MRIASVLVALATTLVASTDARRGRPARIIGGHPVSTGFDWMVTLKGNGEHFCGGSYIGDGWVLTAAHCVVEGAPDSVTIGTYTLKGKGGKSYKVAKTIIHADYNDETVLNDIAMLKLKEVPADTASIALDTTNAYKAGDTAAVIGWGLTEEDGDSLPNELQYVQVPVVHQVYCRRAYAHFGQNIITDSHVCAGYKGGAHDSCNGDSGGPLFLENDKTGPLQIGIVSFGEGCGQRGRYGVYTRLSSFGDWISGVQDGSITGTGPDTDDGDDEEEEKPTWEQWEAEQRFCHRQRGQTRCEREQLDGRCQWDSEFRTCVTSLPEPHDEYDSTGSGHGTDEYESSGTGHGTDEYDSTGSGHGTDDEYESSGSGHGTDEYESSGTGHGTDEYESSGTGHGTDEYDSTGSGHGTDEYESSGTNDYDSSGSGSHDDDYTSTDEYSSNHTDYYSSNSTEWDEYEKELEHCAGFVKKGECEADADRCWWDKEVRFCNTVLMPPGHHDDDDEEYSSDDDDNWEYSSEDDWDDDWDWEWPCGAPGEDDETEPHHTGHHGHGFGHHGTKPSTGHHKQLRGHGKHRKQRGLMKNGAPMSPKALRRILKQILPDQFLQNGVPPSFLRQPKRRSMKSKSTLNARQLKQFARKVVKRQLKKLAKENENN